MHVRSNTRKVSDPRKISNTRKISDPRQILIRRKKLIDPRQNFVDPRNPHNPRKSFTHATHAPTYLRTHVIHATQEPTQPTQFSRLFQNISTLLQARTKYLRKTLVFM